MSTKDLGTGRTGTNIGTHRTNATGRDNEYETEIHYERKLGSVFESASPDGTIRDETEWSFLIAMFLKHRLVSIEDTKKLDLYRPCFPVTFETLVQTICQAFGDQ